MPVLGMNRAEGKEGTQVMSCFGLHTQEVLTNFHCLIPSLPLEGLSKLQE